jgi:hypothetical protein
VLVQFSGKQLFRQLQWIFTFWCCPHGSLKLHFSQLNPRKHCKHGAHHEKKGNMQCQTPQRKTLHSATFRVQILDKHIPTPIKVSNTSEAAPCPKGLHQFQEVTTRDQNNLNSMLIEF